MRENNTGPEFSTAGFFHLDGTGRHVFDFRPNWRFLKSDVEGAEAPDFDDTTWQSVTLPHGLELLPAEASGSINYQGPAWYRKQFTIPDSLQGKKLFLHFEGIMGRSSVWINGKLLARHFGGFLPIHIDMTACINEGENVIAVRTDNSNDPSYPPGKPQEHLDWTYFGGIYRDVWLIATNGLYITNANAVDNVAGGGLFARTAELSSDKAEVEITVDMANDCKATTCVVENTLMTTSGDVVAQASSDCAIDASAVVQQTLTIAKPDCWTPQHPALYNLHTIVKVDGEAVDGYRTRMGIRTIDFRGVDGFYLNQKPYQGKLMGGNRHQDFAYVGNALPNSMHYRDAKRLRDAGMTVIRSAHYPLDPAFMDACDELGLFVIVATPGWQFFSREQLFQDRVCDDIRNMVRRDRNRPCVLLWECVLNEVKVTDAFARRTHEVTHEEYPFPGCFTAADGGQDINSQVYDVLYAHYNREFPTGKCYFQREWGDHVDDFHAHNSPSRVSRNWGESPQLVQALHYANAAYPHPCWQSLCDTPRQFVGGCLWHSFDHQRGYHPDPFWGGIMDAFRQPKYSYYLFASQQNPEEAGPMIFIANEMTPFSDGDVWIFTNCDQVRLKAFGEVVGTKTATPGGPGMPHPPVGYENVYRFSDLKARGGIKHWPEQEIVAEGLIDGKVVATCRRAPARRKSRIELRLDDCGVPLTADGADFTTVIAEVVDEAGLVKHLSQDWIRFEVEGQGVIIGDHTINANPRLVEWGSAPVLIRSTRVAGPITVKARPEFPGMTTPAAGQLTLKSVPSHKPEL